MKKIFLGAAFALLAATPASATVFVEEEPNNSVATAQVLTHDGSISLTGFREAIAINTFTDFFRFEATAGDNISFAVNAIGGGDPLIQLRDGSGGFLVENDDGGPGLNSLINFNVTDSGEYVGALRGFANSTYSYNLSITGLTASAAVPEPATWAFMIFGFGAIGAAMRRRRKANVKLSYA